MAMEKIGRRGLILRIQIMIILVSTIVVWHSPGLTSLLLNIVGADIDHHHPDVCIDLLNWGTWILSQLGSGAAGFRFDAIKHIDREFISKFVKHVRKDRDKLFAVGEFWKDSVEDLEAYLDALGTQVRMIAALFQVCRRGLILDCLLIVQRVRCSAAL
jgi:hypothetical protein